MRFLSRLNPGPGIVDFWTEFRRPNPYRWPALGIAMLITFTLLYLFTQERVVLPPERPVVTYITSFAPDRSEEEIIAANIANQQKQDEIARLAEERQERIRDMYRTLGEMSGMDVERIEREAAEERAAEQAAAAATADIPPAQAPDAAGADAAPAPTIPAADSPR